ncbi:putative serpin-Z6A [Aegilops tauschii subsp. strangulata]|uniref:putative serpin-Z6A n=1 Tax=Aegilops tauschii subsp. strangulata TaxID=200361 RepID=UPI00098A082A|nr:putative serpin-Z6A [Aegilops tauschii subsp. strangulata]
MAMPTALAVGIGCDSGSHGQVDVPFMQSRESQFVAVHQGFKVLKLRYKMGAPDHKGTTKHSPPLGRPDSDPYSYNGVGAAPYAHPRVSAAYNRGGGGPSPNYFPVRPHPYFHQHYYPPPFRNSFSPYTYPRPYPPYGALGPVGYPPNPYLPRHDAFGNSYYAPNEEGTEAAAVTITECGYGGCSRLPPPPPQVDFIVDHPFAYYIMEEATGTVVFADPSKE